MADRICDRLVDGRALRSICLDEDVVSFGIVVRWINTIPEFFEQYARARAVQVDVIFDEMHHIADTPVCGAKTIRKDDGKIETIEADMIEHRRLQIETRKWMLGKLAPKKYGIKADINLTASIAKYNADDLKDMSDDDIERVQSLLQRLAGPGEGEAGAGGSDGGEDET